MADNSYISVPEGTQTRSSEELVALNEIRRLVECAAKGLHALSARSGLSERDKGYAQALHMVVSDAGGRVGDLVNRALADWLAAEELAREALNESEVK